MAPPPQLDPETLRRLRISRGFSLAALGSLVGVSESAVYRWESGSRAPRSCYLAALADALCVSISDLMDSEADAA